MNIHFVLDTVVIHGLNFVCFASELITKCPFEGNSEFDCYCWYLARKQLLDYHRSLFPSSWTKYQNYKTCLGLPSKLCWTGSYQKHCPKDEKQTDVLPWLIADTYSNYHRFLSRIYIWLCVVHFYLILKMPFFNLAAKSQFSSCKDVSATCLEMFTSICRVTIIELKF